MINLAIGGNTLHSAATILVNNLIAILNDTKAPPSRLEEALKPFAGFRRQREMINYIAVGEINRLFGRLKRSMILKDTQRLAINHIRQALAGPIEADPVRFDEWQSAVTRSSPNTLVNPDTWIEVWNTAELHRIPDPLILARISLDEMNAISSNSPIGEVIAPLWQAHRLEHAQELDIPAPTLAFRKSVTAIKEVLRAGAVDESVLGEDYGSKKQVIGHPPNFEQLGPVTRVAELQSPVPSSQHIRRFLSAGA